MVLVSNYHVQAQPATSSLIPMPVRVITNAQPACPERVSTVKGSRIPRPVAKAVKVVKKILPGYMRATAASAVRAATRPVESKGAQKAPSKKHQQLPVTVRGSRVQKRQHPVSNAPEVPLTPVAKLRRHVQLKLLPVKAFIRGPPSFAGDAAEDCFTVDRRLLPGEKARKDFDRTVLMNKFVSGLRLKHIFPLAPSNSPPSDWCFSPGVSSSFCSNEDRSFSGLPAASFGAYAPPAEPEDDSLLDDLSFPELSQSELSRIKDKLFSAESLSDNPRPEKLKHGTLEKTDSITHAMENLTMENDLLAVVPHTRLSAMPSDVVVLPTRRLASRVVSGGICVSAVWSLL